MLAQSCLRSLNAWGLRRLVVAAPPLTLWKDQRATYAAKPAKGAAAEKQPKTILRIKAKDVPRSNYTTRKGMRNRKKSLEQITREKQKADPSLKKPKEPKQKKDEQKLAPGEEEKVKMPAPIRLKSGVGDDDDDMRPGDFLFQYARYNLGHQALTRPISLQTREAMWQLYDADHMFWTPARIGTKFGFSLEVTIGIILMKAYEKYLQRRHERRLRKFHQQQDQEKQLCIAEKRRFFPKKVPRCPLLTDDLEVLMGQEFGWMSTENVAPQPDGGFGLFSDIAMIGDNIDMGLLARASFKVAPPPHELPTKPPPIYIPPRQISGPTRANKFHRSKLLILDVSKKERKNKDENRFMMMRDLDGSLRTPSWKERVWIQKHVMTNRPTQNWLIGNDPLKYYRTRSQQPYKGKH